MAKVSIKRASSIPLQADFDKKLSFKISACDTMDLPNFEDAKTMSGPGTISIKDVINFA
jgi:hypothetical protein